MVVLYLCSLAGGGEFLLHLTFEEPEATWGGHRGSRGGEDGRWMALNCGFARRKGLTLSRMQLLFPDALPSLASCEAQISS